MMSKRGPLNVMSNDNNLPPNHNRLSVGGAKSRQSLGRDMLPNGATMGMNHMGMNSMGMNPMNVGINGNLGPTGNNHTQTNSNMPRRQSVAPNHPQHRRTSTAAPFQGSLAQFNANFANLNLNAPPNHSLHPSQQQQQQQQYSTSAYPPMGSHPGYPSSQPHHYPYQNSNSNNGNNTQTMSNHHHTLYSHAQQQQQQQQQQPHHLHSGNHSHQSGGPRRSSIGPSSLSAASTSLSAQIKSNPREYILSHCDALIKFLLSRNFNAVPLSHHTLVENPSEIHTRQIFAFVYRQIDPAYPFPEKMNDWPAAMANALDHLRYPLANELPASKLSMATSPHVYPHFFAAIVWLMNLFHIVYEAETIEENMARFTPGKFFYTLVEESFDEKVIQPKPSGLAFGAGGNTNSHPNNGSHGNGRVGHSDVDDRIAIKVGYQNEQLKMEWERLHKMSVHFEEQLEQLARLHPSLDSMRETRMKVEAAKQLLSHALVTDQSAVQQTEALTRQREESLRALKRELEEANEGAQRVQQQVDQQVIHIEHFDKLKTQLSTLLDEQSDFKRKLERGTLEKTEKEKVYETELQSVDALIKGLQERVLQEWHAQESQSLQYGDYDVRKSEAWCETLGRVRGRLEMARVDIERVYQSKREELVLGRTRLEEMKERVEQARDQTAQQQTVCDRLEEEFRTMKETYHELSQRTSQEVIDLSRKIAKLSKDAQADLQRVRATLSETRADQENRMKEITETFRYSIDKCYMPALEELVRFKQHIEAQLMGLVEFVKKNRVSALD